MRKEPGRTLFAETSPLTGRAFVEADARDPRQVQSAEDHDDRADQRRDAEDLLAFDPESHEWD